jgi:hypothetical protein
MFINLDMDRFDLSALRQSISAGEPLNPEVITQWKKIHRHRNPRFLRPDRIHRHDRQPALDDRQDAQRFLRVSLLHVRRGPGGRRGQ